jgi:hypothetical protein
VSPLERALTYIAARLREPSTYPHIMIIAGAVGHWGAADVLTQQQIIMDCCLFAAGLIGAILPDRIGNNTRAGDPAKPTDKET